MAEPIFLKNVVTNYDNNFLQDIDKDKINSCLDYVSGSNKNNNSDCCYDNTIGQTGKDVMTLLTDRNITSLILTGKESVDKLLFPMLNKAFNSDNVNKKEKDDLAKRLSNNFNKSKILLKQEINQDYIKRGEEGIDYFSKNLSSKVNYKIKL